MRGRVMMNVNVVGRCLFFCCLCAALLVAGCGGDRGEDTAADTYIDGMTLDVGEEVSSDVEVTPDGFPDTSDTPDVVDASDLSDVGDTSRPDSVSDTTAPDLIEDIDVTPPPEPPAAPEISPERLTQLAQTIDAALDAMPTAQTSALVIEAESGRVLYSRNPDLALVPASNTKLFTTAAALSILGPDYRFTTRVYGDSAPDAGGQILGDLHAVVEGDFTWSDYFYTSARVPLDQLADDLYGAGVRSISGDIWVRGEVVYDGFSLGYLDPAAQRTRAVSAFRDALIARGVTVGGTTQVSPSFDPPAGGVELATWRSVSLIVACSPINRSSHNEFADALFRHLGHAVNADSSEASGRLVVMSWLSAQGFDASNGLNFADGSGLSYENLVSARQVVDLISLMGSDDDGAVWSRTFSIAGVRGTLSGRMTGVDTIGRVFGKSGTLNISITTSGLLVHKHDGRRYIFSVLMNEPSISSAAARSAQNGLVSAVAAELLEVGARPGPPTLHFVGNEADGDAVRVRWAPVAGAQGYFVWVSADGERWSRDEARYTEETEVILRGFSSGDRVFAKISAVNDQGESDTSDVYVAGVSDAASALLLVDGQDRWQRQPVPENTLTAAHDYLPHHGSAVTANIGFDSCANEDITGETTALADYQAVVWSVGEDSEADDSLNSVEQGLLSDYLGGGGALMLSGAEIGWDLVAQGQAGEPEFFSTTLKASYLGDDAGTYLVRGSGGIFSDLPIMNFYLPDETVAAYPDQLGVAGGSLATLDYVGGAGGVAALQYEGSYRLVLLGFPFEVIDNADDRALLMERTLEFFGVQ